MAGYKTDIEAVADQAAEQFSDVTLVTALFCAISAAALVVIAGEYTDLPLYGSADASVTAALEAEACIAQFGAGERWARHAHVYACAAGVVDPQHILSYPLVAQ